MSHESRASDRFKHARAAVLVATSLLLMVACGPSTSITLSLDSSSVEVFLGAGAEVDVTLTRSAGATAPVTLSASGAPAWMTVTFSPATLSGDTLAATMTVSTDGDHPDAAPAAVALTVTAQGAGLSAAAQLTVEVMELDVSGTVIGGRGEPLAGHTVYIPGHTATVSSADGTFSFDNVVAPYDLSVADPIAGFVHTFVGLTTPNPTVRPLNLALSLTNEYSTSITGTLSHATLIPVPASHRAIVCAEGLDVPVLYGCGTVAPTSSSYLIEPQWATESTTRIRLRAYVFQVDVHGEPTGIVASGTFGALDITNGVAESQNIVLADTSSQAIVNVTSTVPTGYTIAIRQLMAELSEVASSSLGSEVDATSALTRDVVAPFFAGVDYSLIVGATSNLSSGSSSIAWSVGHAPGDSVSLVLPRPAVQVSPPDLAAGVSEETEFAVVNPDGGVATFYIFPTGAGTTYAVTTEGTAATIPDLAIIGLALPAATEYMWTVLTTHDVATIDDAVTEGGFFGEYLRIAAASGGAGPGAEADGRISTSEVRTFTSE